MRRPAYSRSRRVAAAPSRSRGAIISSRTAVFRQMDKDVPQVHPDALEFPDGTCVLLTDLREGQQATVLQLPARPKTPAEAAAQTRVVYLG
jgi:hypothetical protein